jgi:hypothetical protein
MLSIAQGATTTTTQTLVELREGGTLIWSAAAGTTAAAGQEETAVGSVSGVDSDGIEVRVGKAERELVVPVGAGRSSFTAHFA